MALRPPAPGRSHPRARSTLGRSPPARQLTTKTPFDGAPTSRPLDFHPSPGPASSGISTAPGSRCTTHQPRPRRRSAASARDHRQGYERSRSSASPTAAADASHEVSTAKATPSSCASPSTATASSTHRRYPPVARTYCALASSSTYLGRRVSKSMILAQVGVMRMSTICL